MDKQQCNTVLNETFLFNQEEKGNNMCSTTNVCDFTIHNTRMTKCLWYIFKIIIAAVGSMRWEVMETSQGIREIGLAFVALFLIFINSSKVVLKWRLYFLCFRRSSSLIRIPVQDRRCFQGYSLTITKNIRSMKAQQVIFTSGISPGIRAIDGDLRIGVRILRLYRPP